jgi:hypothetical protein
MMIIPDYDNWIAERELWLIRMDASHYSRLGVSRIGLYTDFT